MTASSVLSETDLQNDETAAFTASCLCGIELIYAQVWHLRSETAPLLTPHPASPSMLFLYLSLPKAEHHAASAESCCDASFLGADSGLEVATAYVFQCQELISTAADTLHLAHKCVRVIMCPPC